MKYRLIVLTFLCASLFNVLLAEPPSYIETKDGVIIFTDPKSNGILPFYWDPGSGVINRQNNSVLDQQALDALIQGGQ